MSFHYRYRKQIIIVVVILLLLGSGVVFYKTKFSSKTKVTNSKVVVKNNSNVLKKEKSEKVEKELYKVDIKGEIVNPGIYSLDSESRVIDVINNAGGLTENADTTVINLSKKIKDEMVIIVYSKEEVNDFKTTKVIEKQVNEKCIQKDNNALINDACISSYEDSINNTKIININTATLEELKTLPGVGEGKANNIIKYRDSNGLFKSIEEIKKVDGIGENLYAQIETFITV